MSIIFKNNAATTLSAGITAIQTNIPITNGSAFPEITGSDVFYVTLDDEAGTYEVLKVTAHSAGGTALTVVRGIDGSTNQLWPINTLIEMRVVKSILDSFVSGDDDEVVLNGNLTVNGGVTFSSGISVPNGGTGLTTLTNRSLLVGAGTSDVDFLAPTKESSQNSVVATTDGVNWTSKSIYNLVNADVVQDAMDVTQLTVSGGGTGRATLTVGSALVGNGTNAVDLKPIGTVFRIPNTYYMRHQYEFSIAGYYSLTLPEFAGYLYIKILGAGGGAGGFYHSGTGPGEGGGGGPGGALEAFISYTGGADLGITVGAGGAGAPDAGDAPGNGNNYVNGTAGGTTTIIANPVFSEGTISCQGGDGGAYGSYGASGTHGVNGVGVNVGSAPAMEDLDPSFVPPLFTKLNGSLVGFSVTNNGGGMAGGETMTERGLTNGQGSGTADSGEDAYILIQVYC